MRIKLILFLFLTSNFYCFSIGNPVDSLAEQLTKSSGKQRIDILNQLAERYRNSNIDTTLYLAELALNESNAINYQEGIADAFHKKGIYYYFTDDYENALRFYNKSKSIAKKLKNKRLEAQALAWIGSIYRVQAKHKNAQLYYNDALKLSRRINDKQLIIYCLRSIGDDYRMQLKNDLALEYLTEAINICNESNNVEEKAFILIHLGELYQIQSEFFKSTRALNEAITLSRKINNKNIVCIGIYTLGEISLAKSDYVAALNYFNQSLNLANELKDKIRLIDCYLSIGDVYRLQNDLKKAMEYYKQASLTADEINSPNSKAYCLMVIADVYKTKGEYNLAIEYLNKSESIALEIEDLHRLSEIYLEIGEIYQNKLEFQQSLNFYEKALELGTKIQNRSAISTSHIHIGEIDFNNKKYKEAIEKGERGMKIAIEIQNLENIYDASKLLYQSYKKIGDYSKAILNLERHKSANDTIIAHNNSKILIQNQMNFEFDKEKEKNKIEQAKKDANASAHIQVQRNIIISSIVILLFVVGFSIFIFLANKKQKKANLLLGKQNNLIENQKKEITDSINYAQRIQNAILPEKDSFFSVFPKSFILHLPKDIVSGDFYFFFKQKISEKIKTESYIVAAADCTGHGVPGALMSMISHQKLEEAVSKLVEPRNILKRLNKRIKSVLKQNYEDSISRDGLDISLISCQYINENAIRIKYAGANRPIWIFRKKETGFELEEPELTKASIGGFTENSQEYKQSELVLQKEDSLYLFSDGFADQFGGLRNKKISTKHFKKLLLEIQQYSMKDQQALIEQYLNKWKGKGPQIDDILIIGIRV